MSIMTKTSTAPAPEGAERTPTLSDLCGDAAKHVAQARVALFSERADTDGAIDHLDQAIVLLRRLSAHGRAMGLSASPAKLYSA